MQQAAYGAQQFGQQMQQGFGGAGAAMGLQPGALKPRIRNPIITFLLPYLGFVAAGILSTVFGILANALESGIVGLIGGALSGLVALAAMILTLVTVLRMVGELNSVTKTNSVPWWGLFVPFYQYYVMWILIPQEMQKAKQMVGVQQPARGIVVYFFLFLYGFAADLNDIAKQMPG